MTLTLRGLSTLTPIRCLVGLMCCVLAVSCCGKHEYKPSKRDSMCLPCRICPPGVHQGGSGIPIETKCRDKYQDFLPSHMGEHRVSWCWEEKYPVPWCEKWNVDNGQVDCDYRNGSINSICELTCNHGYMAVGQGVTKGQKVTSKCDGNLNWSHTNISCVKNNCVPYEVDRGSVTCPVPMATEGQRCNVTCGREQIDTPTCVRGEDGELKWNTPLPAECPRLLFSDNTSSLNTATTTDNTSSLNTATPTAIVVGVVVAFVLIVAVIIVVIWKKRFTQRNIDGFTSISSSNSSVSYKEPHSVVVEVVYQPDTNSYTSDSVVVVPLNQPNTNDELADMPEWTNQNAGHEHLHRVVEDPTMMRELEKYLNREENSQGITWHKMAEKFLGFSKIRIQHEEYKDKSKACYTIMSEIYQQKKDVSLKDVLEFFVSSREDIEKGTEEYMTHTKLICQMFNVGNGRGMNSDINCPS